MTLRDEVRGLFTSFVPSRTASISILAAILATLIVSVTGIGIDLGSVVYWQSRLQAATDTAALAAAFDPSRLDAIAAAALHQNGPAAALIQNAEIGSYTDDPGVAESARFTPGGSGNAVRVVTRYQVPMYFTRVLTGHPQLAVNATAVAYNLPLAGIAIGSAASDSDVDELNAFIDAQSGSSFELTEAERDALDATRISVFRLIDRIASQVASSATPIGTVTDLNINLVTLANAAAEALAAQTLDQASDVPTALSALQRIAAQSGDSPLVPIEDYFAVTAHDKRAAQDLISASNDALGVPALALLIGYVQASRQNALVNENQSVSLPGPATISVDAVLGREVIGGGARGFATLAPVGGSAYSSRGRVRFTISLPPIQILGLSLPVSLPLIADIAYGSATISEVSCGSDILGSTAIDIEAQSGAARVIIGYVPDDELADLGTPLTPLPAQIIDTPLVSVTADGNSTVGTSAPTTLQFTREDIAQGTTKTVTGTPSTSDAIDQLDPDVSVVANMLLPPGTGALISGVVQAQLSAILTALQPQIDGLLANLGLRLGSIDVRASGVRCGVPALVT